MANNKSGKIIANEINIVYFLAFDEGLNIPFEKFVDWPKCTVDYWSASNFFKCNIQSLAKYPKINYTGFGGNNIAKFVN